jgi:two-component system, oxyanion-binding sensor
MTALRTAIRLGFIPLLDAAIPIIAARQGFAAARGLDLHLVRETSWANIRDRLAIGQFDAAHLLAPMPVAAALGLAPLDVPLIAPMALGHGGNAITVSAALMDEMRALVPDARPGDPFGMGRALNSVVEARRKAGMARLVFAVVHPYSAHNYELRYWLAVSGVVPETDIEILILPPPFMPDALASGRLDGFCVGEPWNSVASRMAGGTIILTKSAIWRASPEKVLGLRADWADRHPETLAALLQAMLDAADWCGDKANHPALARTLSAPEFLDLPEVDILPACDGRLDGAGEFLTYSAGFANFPWKSDAEWFFRQMVRWGQAGAGSDALARVRASYRPDLFRAAMLARNLSAPAIDDRPVSPDGDQAGVLGTLGNVRLPRSGFFDAARLEAGEP